MKPTRRTVLFAAAFMLAAGLLPAGHLQFPLISSFSAFPLQDVSLEQEQGSLALFVKEANSFSYNPTQEFYNDFEMSSFSLIYRERVSPKSNFYMQLSCDTYWGGFLDRFVEKFHDLFGFPSAGREKYARNIVNYSFRDYFGYGEKVGSLSPLLLLYDTKILDNGKLDLHLVGGASIPLRSKPGFVSGKPALLLGGGLNFVSGNSRFRVSQLFSFFKRPQWLPEEDLRFFISQTELQFLTGKFRFAVLFRTSPFRETEAASTGKVIVIGFWPSPVLEIGLEEDFSPFDTTFDISFFLRLRIF